MNGNKQEQCTYKNGKQQGTYIRWSEDGKKKETGLDKDGIASH